MEKVREPYFQVLYNSKDITADVTRHLLSLTYTDAVEGESDEIELEFEDVDGLWRGPWYPEKGAQLQVTIGYTDAKLPCGVFELDEIEHNGPPDVVRVRGLAAAITGSLRTKRSDAHEGKTLRQIAVKVAQRNGLTVAGTIPEVRFERVTQSRETDLAFLRRISAEYGCLFSVRGKQLIFTTVFELEKSTAATAIDRLDIASYSIKDTSCKVYKDAKVKYHNPKKNEVVASTFAFGSEPYAEAATGDTKVIHTKAENQQQAELKAKAALHKANSRQQEGSLKMEGNPLAVAGNNFELTGMGQISGLYHITRSVHTLVRDAGYTTEATIKRVGYVAENKQASTKRATAKTQQAQQASNVSVQSQSVSIYETYRRFYQIGLAAKNNGQTTGN